MNEFIVLQLNIQHKLPPRKGSNQYQPSSDRRENKDPPIIHKHSPHTLLKDIERKFKYLVRRLTEKKSKFVFSSHLISFTSHRLVRQWWRVMFILFK